MVGVSVTVDPAGAPVRVSATEPVKLVRVREMPYAAASPAKAVTEAGAADSAKPLGGGALTTSPTLSASEVLPLVAVTVKLCDFTGVDAVVVTTSCDVALVVVVLRFTVGGESDAVVPAGSEAAERVVAPVNPPLPVMVTV